MKELLTKPLPVIPDDIQEKLAHSQITLTPYENRNDILTDYALQQEVGFTQFHDGSWLVSMICPMPGITKEMIEWWFWWHCQENLRYQIWFPGAHISTMYKKKDRAYFEQETMPPFQPNSQCPVEKIGDTQIPLQIDFVTPEQFGFSKQAMEKNNIPVIVCGHVSAFGGLIPHTEMAHIYKKTEDGLFLISRFWLGKTMTPWLRKLIVTDKLARGMAEHCCVEYRNLVEILLGLFEENQ